jgi:hypothetical protein
MGKQGADLDPGPRRGMIRFLNSISEEDSRFGAKFDYFTVEFTVFQESTVPCLFRFPILKDS